MLKKQQGDTIVEVLFATATAALLIVVTLVIMNRNLAQIQIGVETTFVRQAIDSQAEVLSYMRDQYNDNPSATTGIPKLWKDMVSGAYTQTQATPFGVCQPGDNGSETGEAAGKAFFIKPNPTTEAEGGAVDINNIALSNSLALSQTYAQPGQGLWIESVNPNFGASTIRYVDFHIRACWDPPFNGPKATLGTIVRLYYETP
jgi:hypothetical protein